MIAEMIDRLLPKPQEKVLRSVLRPTNVAAFWKGYSPARKPKETREKYLKRRSEEKKVLTFLQKRVLVPEKDGYEMKLIGIPRSKFHR